MCSRLIRQKWHCKVIPKALLLTFGEYATFEADNKESFRTSNKRYVLYIHDKIFGIQRRSCTIDFVTKTSLHWYHFSLSCESKKIKTKTNTNDSHYCIDHWRYLMARILVPQKRWKRIVNNYLNAIVKFRVFRGGGREEMSTDIVRNSMRSAAAGVPRVLCNL